VWLKTGFSDYGVCDWMRAFIAVHKLKTRRRCGLRRRDLILAGLFAALTAIGARLAILLPGITGVPFTLQVVFVFLAGALLGPFPGAVSQLTYLLLGVIGIPVFARGTAGLGVLLGPTGGYLIAYPLAAFLVGWLANLTFAKQNGRGRPWWLWSAVFLANLSGLLLIYSLGLAQFFHYSLSHGKVMNLQEAIALTVLPFWAFDLFKAGLAAWLTLRVKRIMPFVSEGI